MVTELEKYMSQAASIIIDRHQSKKDIGNSQVIKIWHSTISEFT